MSESPFQRITALFAKRNSLILVTLFVSGLVLLLLSSLPGEEGGQKELSFDEAAYVAALEERTEALLSKVQGVGEVHVMITLDSHPTLEYAADKSVQEETGGERKDAQFSQNIVLQTEKGGVKTPVLQSLCPPRVRGVSAVCTGASGAEVRQRIIETLAALFNLKSNQISVTN